MTLLDAVKLAYRKHAMHDSDVGWQELADALLDALCNEMTDDGFQTWHDKERDRICRKINEE